MYPSMKERHERARNVRKTEKGVLTCYWTYYWLLAMTICHMLYVSTNFVYDRAFRSVICSVTSCCAHAASSDGMQSKLIHLLSSWFEPRGVLYHGHEPFHSISDRSKVSSQPTYLIALLDFWVLPAWLSLGMSRSCDLDRDLRLEVGHKWLSVSSQKASLFLLAEACRFSWGSIDGAGPPSDDQLGRNPTDGSCMEWDSSRIKGLGGLPTAESQLRGMLQNFFWDLIVTNASSGKMLSWPQGLHSSWRVTKMKEHFPQQKSRKRDYKMHSWLIALGKIVSRGLQCWNTLNGPKRKPPATAPEVLCHKDKEQNHLQLAAQS